LKIFLFGWNFLKTHPQGVALYISISQGATLYISFSLGATNLNPKAAISPKSNGRRKKARNPMASRKSSHMVVSFHFSVIISTFKLEIRSISPT